MHLMSEKRENHGKIAFRCIMETVVLWGRNVLSDCFSSAQSPSLYFWNAMCISSVLVKETGREMWSLSEEGVSNCVVMGLCLGPVTSACCVIFNS